MSDDGWTGELSSTAEDDLDGLSPADQDRILDKLDEIVSSSWRDPPDYGEPLQVTRACPGGNCHELPLGYGSNGDRSNGRAGGMALACYVQSIAWLVAAERPDDIDGCPDGGQRGADATPRPAAVAAADR